jgi:tetratricopeptide (TPR) repeat protein
MTEREILLRSAQKYLTSNKTNRALDEYLKLLKSTPTDWNLMIQVADLYLKMNQTGEAIKYFQKVADHYTAEGFVQKAIAIYRRILKVNPELFEIRVKLAEFYFRERHFLEGNAMLEGAIKIARSKGDLKITIDLLNKMLELDPQNITARKELASAYEKKGMVSEAVAAHLELSNSSIAGQRFDEAQESLERAYGMNQKNGAVLLRLMWICMEKEENEKAAVLLKEFLDLDLSSNPEMLLLVAKCFASEKHLEKLQEFIDEKIEANIRKEAFRILMGELYLKRGDLKNAFCQFLMAIEEQANQRELGKGVTLLRKITRLDSSFYPAWRMLIDLYKSLGDNENVILCYSSLSDAYISKTMYEDAAACLHEVIEMEPKNRWHKDKLAFVESLLEKPDALEQQTAATSKASGTESFDPIDFDLEIDLDESLGFEVRKNQFNKKSETTNQKE